MEKKKNTYFVKIDSDFLFDINKMFKSRYTPWIYLFLKLEYNYYIQKVPNKTISLKSEVIAKFFQIDRATVHRAINELIDNRFVTRKERDSYVVHSERGNYKENSNSNYLEIYKNLLIDIFQNGANIDDAKVYYYMIFKNKHYAFDYKYLESDLSQTKISRNLGLDSRKTKTILSKLLEIGLVSIDQKTKKYMTTYPRGDGISLITKEKFSNKPIENEQKDENQSGSYDKLIDDYLKSFKNEEIPIHGWFKTSSGNSEIPVIKIPDFGYAVDERRAKESDGISPSAEQMEIQIKLVTDNLSKKMLVLH